jgi:hypothetical protein
MLDCGHPVIKQPGILSGAAMIGMTGAARTFKIVQLFRNTLKP